MALNSLFKERHKKVHLVGIGGIGMSGIARVLLESGFSVTGSDIADSLEIQALSMLGAKIYLHHDYDHVGDADVVVFSSAVLKDNPELIQAHKNNIPLIPRAIMLAELMRLKCGIAVSGAHGKTTTTSLIATLMYQVGLDPTIIIGGIVNHFGSNAILGHSQFMVTEADESDGTFLHLSPTIAVITNIDAEHLDFYPGGIAEIKESFSRFLHSLPFYGLGVACIDDPHIRDLLPSINRRITTYGLTEDAIYRAVNIETVGLTTYFDLLIHKTLIGRFVINMVGHYNVLNSLAAIAVLEEIGIKAADLADALKDFNGVKRRFTQMSPSNDFLVIDDYAHHPTEIKAVLKAARNSFSNKKLRVLFQPHRFSRTRDLMNEFSSCFTDCDSLVITEIYPAAEKPIDGVNAKTLIAKIKENSSIDPHHATDIIAGADQIVALCEKDDVVLTLGAGSITQAAPRIVDLLTTKYPREISL